MNGVFINVFPTLLKYLSNIICFFIIFFYLKGNKYFEGMKHSLEN